jgi:septum formation protein
MSYADRNSMTLLGLWYFAFALSTPCHHEITHQGFYPSMTMTTTNESLDYESPAPPPLLISFRDRLATSGIHYSAGSSENSTPSILGQLILASQSPRRREILDLMGLRGKYSVEPSPLNESELQEDLMKQKLLPRDYTRRLAEAKAHALAVAHLQEDDVISIDDDDGSYCRPAVFYLGSDTIVELDETILEKPKDAQDAKRMLQSMSGRQHHVHTGVALYRLFQKEVSLIDSFTDTASVTFSRLREEDIDAYIASKEPLDKAGSYGIQGIGGQLVEAISGDFFTVMGLPMSRTSQLMGKALQDEDRTVP